MRGVAYPFTNVSLRAGKPTAGGDPLELRSVGDHIRARRLKLGLFQAGAAERMGVSEATIHAWERGCRKPSVRRWPGLLAFLGYDPHPEPITTAEKLTAVRRRRGWSQDVLAEHLDVDEGTIRKWERGRGPERRALRARVEGFLNEGATALS